jgi:CRISPR/Cas system-associated endoribonuclease Cas2
MAVLVVTYDLNKEVKRPKIVAEVNKTDWARLSESSYAIDTTETPEEVYDRFKYLLDGNDNLYVITLKRPYFGQGPQDVNSWLEQRLTW